MASKIRGRLCLPIWEPWFRDLSVPGIDLSGHPASIRCSCGTTKTPRWPPLTA